MSDEIVPERLSTIPEELERAPAKEPLHATLVRVHEHDYTLLRVLLKKDRLSFQKFVYFCVRAYLDADPSMMRMLKSYRELETVPHDIQDKHVLSHRERAEIYNALESAEREGQK